MSATRLHLCREPWPAVHETVRVRPAARDGGPDPRCSAAGVPTALSAPGAHGAEVRPEACRLVGRCGATPAWAHGWGRAWASHCVAGGTSRTQRLLGSRGGAAVTVALVPP